MFDRQKLETLLCRRFPGSTRDQIAAAANAIMGMKDEWEEGSRSVLDKPERDASASGAEAGLLAMCE
jgi:hypothetical protein